MRGCILRVEAEATVRALLCGRRRFLRTRRRVESETQFVSAQSNRDRAAAFELAEEDLVGERIANLGLNHARERPRAIDRIVALDREPRARFWFERDGDAPLRELRL